MQGKHTFFTGQPIFSQLLNLIPSSLVARLADKHKANHYCKTFKAYDHLVTMLYQGFFQCLSLRELTTGLLANAQRLRHLGLRHTPRRSTLSDANARRSADFFEELYHQLYRQYFSPDSPKGSQRLFIIDSTTISLFSSIMKGAGSYKSDGRKKGGAKAHVMLDAQHNLPCFVRITEGRHHDLTFLNHLPVPAGSLLVFDKAYINYNRFMQWSEQGISWVTRQKNDAFLRVDQCCDLSEESKSQGVIADQYVTLGRPSNQSQTAIIQARRITYMDQQSAKTFVFLTNDKSMAPQEVAAIYKQRWQIELLFKRIKQRYPLRYFLGENENAIRIQIWAALICDLLIQIVKHQLKNRCNWSYANLSSMVKHHLMTYINLWNFLMQPEKALLKIQFKNENKGTLFDTRGALF